MATLDHFVYGLKVFLQKVSNTGSFEYIPVIISHRSSDIHNFILELFCLKTQIFETCSSLFWLWKYAQKRKAEVLSFWCLKARNLVQCPLEGTWHQKEMRKGGKIQSVIGYWTGKTLIVFKTEIFCSPAIL